MHLNPKKFLHGLLYLAPLTLLALASCGGAPAPVAVVAPAAPTNVAAANDPGCTPQVKITWTASTGATNYNIYRSTMSGGAKIQANLSSITVASYVDSNLSSATTYYYTVTAVNSGGSSPASSQTAGVTPSPGVTCVGGSIQGTALSLTPTVSTFAGTSGSAGSTNATGTLATFRSPTGITTDGTYLYVADAGNNMIRKIVIATAQVSTLAGSGAKSQLDLTGTAATFNNPTGVTTATNGNVYVADTGNNAIRMITPTGVVSTFYPPVGVTTVLNQPAGITADNTDLYIANTGNNTIEKIVILTGVQTTLAGTANTPGNTDGPGATAKFNSPHGITTDGINLYVADTANKSIRVIAISNGAVTTLTTTSLTNPLGITTDGTNLYVTDTGNNTINTIPKTGGTMSVVAGLNTTTCGNVDGGKATASFCFPSGITTDGTSLYGIDTGKNTVRGIQ